MAQAKNYHQIVQLSKVAFLLGIKTHIHAALTMLSSAVKGSLIKLISEWTIKYQCLVNFTAVGSCQNTLKCHLATDENC